MPRVRQRDTRHGGRVWRAETLASGAIDCDTCLKCMCTRRTKLESYFARAGAYTIGRPGCWSIRITFVVGSRHKIHAAVPHASMVMNAQMVMTM